MNIGDFRNVRRMRDNVAAGYGPSYVSDRDGPAWLFWTADCFDPQVWFIRCAEDSEAFEHAEICLGSELADGDLSESERAEVWENGSGYGFTCCSDGVIRYTETIECRELAAPAHRHRFGEWQESRLAGTPYRECLDWRCREITLDDYETNPPPMFGE